MNVSLMGFPSFAGVPPASMVLFWAGVVWMVVGPALRVGSPSLGPLYGHMALANWIIVASELIGGYIAIAPAVAGVMTTWLWWADDGTRRRRRRAAAAIGAKSRALVAALVRSLQPVPRPVRA